MYVVHYRRKDGTEATAPFETVGDRYRYSWTAPEDCVAVTGVEETGGGGGSVLPVPGAIFSGMTVAVIPGATDEQGVPSDEALAQIAFEAWRDYGGGNRQWSDVQGREREAWEAAAGMVADAVLKRGPGTTEAERQARRHG
jgi:hypothetical protein